MEWQPWAGAEGAWRRRVPQAMRGREVSRGPVTSAAPMVLAQIWNEGETKVRGCPLAKSGPARQQSAVA